MKKYSKPVIEVVELSVKENIASLPQIPGNPAGVTNSEMPDGTILTTYSLGSYSGDVLASI